MRKPLRVPALAALVMLLGCNHQASPTSAATEAGTPSAEQILPLVRVRLYASGMGYFERRGDLAAGQTALPVPTGHLDDALKSLVLFGPDSELVTVSFPSRLSPAVARARAGLPAAEDSALSYDRLLAALRGEEVEVVLRAEPQAQGSRHSFLTPRRLLGRVVEVVAVNPSHPSYDHGPVNRTIPEGHTEPEEPERLHVILLTKNHEVIRFDATEVISVRPLDPSIAERLEAAMSARIASRSNQTQWLELTSGQKGSKTVSLGYLAETPTWRASYRLILSDDNSVDAASRAKAELQAWALIHNDTEETWRNVKLELVDGYPNSFLFPLAAPRYQRRDLSTPEEELSSVPQLSTTTPDAMWGDFSDYQGEAVESLGGGTGTGQGFGSGHGRLGGSHKTKAPTGRSGSSMVANQEPSDLLWVGDLVAEAGVMPAVERAVSIYRVAPSLDLPPQHSAMLPFLKESVTAKPIVWFSTPGSAPERAVGVSNNTANTLPAGPLAVFGRGGFLGEALLESLQPGARQFAHIGDEPDTELVATELKREEERKHVGFRGGALSVHSIFSTTTQLLFKNRTGRTAEVYVGMRIVTNATLSGSDRLDYDSTTETPFAIFDVPEGQGKQRTIGIRQAVMASTSVDSLEPDALAELIADAELPAEERAVLGRAKQPLQDRLDVVRQEKELQLEREAVEADLERLKAATDSLGSKDSGEANAAVVQRLLQRHDELRKLEAKKRELDKTLESRTTTLQGVLSGLDAFRVAILEVRQRAEKAGDSAPPATKATP